MTATIQHTPEGVFAIINDATTPAVKVDPASLKIQAGDGFYNTVTRKWHTCLSRQARPTEETRIFIPRDEAEQYREVRGFDIKKPLYFPEKILMKYRHGEKVEVEIEGNLATIIKRIP